MIDINSIASLCAETAFKRGKISDSVEHWKTAGGISEELMEFIKADESKPSEHIPEYTEAEEELADILITCLTELNRRSVDIEKIVIDKVVFNQKRDV